MIRVRETATAREVFAPDHQNSEDSPYVAFDPGGRLVTITYGDKTTTVRVFDTVTGLEVRRLQVRHFSDQDAVGQLGFRTYRNQPESQ